MPASVSSPRRDRECRSGSRSPPGGGERNRRPSSRRGLGRRKTRSCSRASLARRRSESPSASGHGRATLSAVSRRPPRRARPSRPSARRRNRQGNSTKPRCRSFCRRCSSNRRASSPISRPWRMSSAWRAKTVPVMLCGTCSKRKLRGRAAAQRGAAAASPGTRPEFRIRQARGRSLQGESPGIADAKKAARLQTARSRVLKDMGFQETELAQSWHGQQGLSLRDHRVQLLIRDATLAGAMRKPRRKRRQPDLFHRSSGPASRSPKALRTTRRSNTSPRSSKKPAT